MKRQEFKSLVSEIDVARYTDYRVFLSKVYESLKAHGDRYSFEQYTKDLGLGASNAMYYYTKGQRSLSVKTAKKISEGLFLKGDRRSYFLKMVEYQSMGSGEQRNELFAKMLKVKAKCLSSDWDKRSLEFFQSWYHTAIYELLRMEQSSDQPEWLVKHLKPTVPINKVRESLALLEALQLVTYDESRDRLFPCAEGVSTGSEIKGFTFKSYHHEMINLSLVALSQEKAANRDISSVTVGLPEEALAEVKKITAEMRQRLLALEKQFKAHDQIYQINIQAFPMTELVSRGSKT